MVYTATAGVWSIVTTSPLHTISSRVLPEFLGVIPGAKTVVLRKMPDGTLNYSIARGHDIYLGDPDVAPSTNPEVAAAIRNAVDGSGVTSAGVLAEYGIKYLFVKSPSSSTLIRTIDGLGGFVRNSATSAGVTWRVVGNSDRLIFTSNTGGVAALPTNEISANFTTSALRRQDNDIVIYESPQAAAAFISVSECMWARSDNATFGR